LWNSIPRITAGLIELIPLVRLEIQLVVHHVEIVVRINLLKIGQILLPLQIVLILLILKRVPIWIVVVGGVHLRLKGAAAQDE